MHCYTACVNPDHARIRSPTLLQSMCSSYYMLATLEQPCYITGTGPASTRLQTVSYSIQSPYEQRKNIRIDQGPPWQATANHAQPAMPIADHAFTGRGRPSHRPWQAIASHDTIASHGQPCQAIACHGQPYPAMTNHDKLSLAMPSHRRSTFTALQACHTACPQALRAERLWTMSLSLIVVMDPYPF